MSAGRAPAEFPDGKRTVVARWTVRANQLATLRWQPLLACRLATPLNPSPLNPADLIIHVQPRSARSEVVGAHGDAIKIRLAAPPVDGAANEELVRFLAERLGVRRSDVAIVRGATGRRKTVRVAGMTTATARRALLGT